jgi:hypothetical protein
VGVEEDEGWGLVGVPLGTEPESEPLLLPLPGPGLDPEPELGAESESESESEELSDPLPDPEPEPEPALGAGSVWPSSLSPLLGCSIGEVEPVSPNPLPVLGLEGVVASCSSLEPEPEPEPDDGGDDEGELLGELGLELGEELPLPLPEPVPEPVPEPLPLPVEGLELPPELATLVQVVPEHFWYSEMGPAPPQFSVLSPAQGILQLPGTPGIGAPTSGIELPQ